MKGYFTTVNLFASLLLFSVPLFGQVNITDPNAANSPDVSKCFGQTELTANVQFTTNAATPANVTVAMPTGVQYLAGSVMLVSQSGGLSISQLSAVPATAPTFRIVASDGTINSGNEIRFKWLVTADCSVTTGTADFPLSINFGGATVIGEVSADVVEADLSLVAHSIQTAAVGTPVTVPIVIQNGGLGATDNITFKITESGMVTSAVTVSGFPATLISTMGTMKTYQIPVAALPGGSLNNPESITVLRTVTLTSCTFSSSYETNWGCNSTSCQSPAPTGPGEFVLAQGSPNLQITSSLVTASNLCGNAVVDVTFTNNGTGPATAAAAFNNVFKFGMNSASGWSSGSWMAVSVSRGANPVTFTGGMSGTPITVSGSQFGSAATGGMSDLDLDGQFDDLPQGASVTFRITLKYTCPTACTAPSDEAALVASGMYTDQCGTAGSTSVSTAFNFVNNGGGTEVFYPARVSNGEKFNVTVCVQRTFSGGNCPTSSFALNLNLPANVMATGVGNLNGTPVAVTTAGNVATVSGPFTSGTTCFTIQLMYTCGGGPMPFSFEALYTCDATCSCVQKWGCGNFSILGSSCVVCANGGLTSTSSVAQRTTLGFTDHNGTTTVNPAAIPPSNLLKGMPCDEFKFTFRGTMDGGTGGNAAFNNGFLEFSYNQLAGGNLLQYIATGSTFDYFDASTGITTTGLPLPTPTDVVVSGRHVLIFNFNAFIQSLPGGQITANDRVVACPRFRVLNNAGLTVTPTQPVNPYAAFFNLATAAGNPLPGGDPRFNCDYDIPEFYLHNPQVIPSAVSGGRAGCGNYQVAGSINHQLTIQNDEYPMEVRPLFRLNSIKVTILNGDTYDPSVTPQLMVSGSPDDPWYMGTFNLPAPTISGNMLTWTNLGNWPIHDLAGATQSSTGYQLKFRLRNSGCANATDGTLQTVWNYNRFGYGPTACQVATTSPTQTGTVAAGAPVFALTNLTGSINGSKEIECYQVRIANNTANPAGYVWLALEDNLSDMDVVSVRDLSTNTSLPLLAYTNGKWVKVSTTWAGNESRTLEVCVRYNNCFNNSLSIKQGWDCSAYPSNPTTYICTPQIQQGTLGVAPRESAIQGDFINTSPLPASMCENFVFDIKVNSSQQGDILDPRVKVTLPTGMLLLPPVQIEYPLNSGNWQNASPTIVGQMVTVDLTNHSLINDSLPGTTNANLATYPNGEDRQARIRFTVRTTCDFFSGDRLLIQPFAQRTCGGAANGSGLEFKSPRIRIQGAEPTYEGIFGISFGTSNTLEGCFARQMNVSVQLSDLNGNDGLAASTGSADTITLSLPLQLDYVPGSYTCTTVPAGNCPVFVGASVAGGRNLLKFKLPASIPIPNGGVVPINFKLLVQPEQSISCTMEDEIRASVLAVYTNISCPNPPPATVCPKVTALAGEGSTPIVLKKRQLTLENVGIACNNIGTFNYTIPVRLQNVALPADSSIVVEIYCLDANGNTLGGPVRTLTITGPKAVGSLTTFTGTFGGCDAVNGVKVVIPLTTYTGQFQCHCAEQVYIYRNLSKCPTVTVSANDTEICANETVTVTAVPANGANGGTWTTSGNGTFANSTALSTVYTPGSTDKANGMVTLKFTTNDLTGTCTPAMATVAVTIRPQPTVANATLTVCASTAGGTSGSFTLTNANSTVDPVGGNAVTYHATLANAQNGVSALSSPYTATNNAVVYARVRNPITGCVSTATVTLRVNALPAANAATLAVCENDPVGSGLGTFTLSNANNTVNSASGLTITYHNTLSEAQSGANALPPVLTTASRVVYARVVNNSTGCANTAQVTLTVRPRPRAYAGVLQKCPDVFDGLTATFTLSNANVQTTGGVAGLTVTYHLNLFEAEQDINPLPNTYTSVTNNIWVRVEDANGCYGIDIVQLVVLENPVLEAVFTPLTCAGVNNGTATALVTSGPLPITYDWSNDGPENPDNDPVTISGLSAGTYNITVTDGNGCTATDFVTIAPAPAAISISVNAVQNVACNGGNNGSIAVTVSGGTPAYTYNWSGSAPDVEDPQGLTAGTYTLTVTDANGCTGTVSATVSQPASALTATASVATPPSACNAANGSATVTASGGVPGYTYLWSNGQTTATATNLGPGSYVVTVTDANGCSKVATVSLPFAGTPVVQIGSVVNVLCAGGNNGSATASVQAGTGTAPFGFVWSNGQSSATATGLAAGSYSVTVTDANGCKSQASVSILQPAPLSVVVVNVQNVTCFGANNGTATAFASGGTPGYSYQWSNNQTGPAATNLSPGVHTVTVTDANGCTRTASVTITQPAPLNLSAVTSSNVSCFGGNNGAINLTVSGGTPNYAFNWTGNAPDVEDPTGLAAGTYTVTVSDAHGCTATTSATVTQPPGLLTAAISASTNTACNGSATGSATVTASGGTPGYTYLWSNGQTNATAINLAAGSYVVTVTDQNGCTAQTTVNIVNPALLQVTVSDADNVTCNGNNNGTFQANVTGGTAPYLYTFSNATNVVIQGPGTLNVVRNLGPGTYTVVVADANGCTTTVSTVITQPTPLSTAVLVTTPVSCFGGSNGTATATASGGTPSYTFEWPGGFTGAVRTGLAAGTYVVTVTDANGCQATATAVIAQPVAPISIVNDLITNVLCNGSATGAIQITVSGGTPNYAYNWSNPAPDVEDPSGLAAGTYNLTVTDNNGCTVNTSVTLSQPTSAVSATISNVVNAQCSGTGTGAATVNPAGGVAPYTYHWSNGQNTQQATGLVAGAYTVTVTDANGCTVVRSVNIANPANLNIQVSSATDVQCNGELNGGATVTATGGTPNYLFNWSNGTSGPILSGVGAGFYQVTVTDNNLCEAVTSVTLTEPTPVVASIQNSTPVSCAGGSNGTATATATGGVGPYTYQWPGAVFGSTRSGLAPGSYTVTVFDAHNCTATATAVIPAAPAALNVQVANFTNVSCNGGDNGAVNITVTGGTPNYNFNWSGAAPDVEDPAGLTAGTYTVTVTDRNGCTTTTSVTIGQPAVPLTATATGINPLCNGAANGSATVTPNGGSPAYTFLWSNGQTTASANNLIAGAYVVTVTDANQCQTVTTVVLANPPALSATISGSSNPLCNGAANGSATVATTGGTPGYAYSWRNSANAVVGTSATATGLSAGTYRVTVTDANGCTSLASVTLAQPTLLTTNIVATTPVSCTGGSDGTATAFATGGTTPYTFNWPGGATGAVRSGLAAGTYVVTVVDANGCTAVAPAVITQPANALTISASAVTAVGCYGAATGAIGLTVSGGTGPYSYDWTAPAPDVEDPTGLPAGSYTVVVTDSKGCTTTQAFTVTQPAAPLSATTTVLSNAPCGTSNGSAMANASGGTSPYNYQWSNGQNTATATSLLAGSYVVTVSDLQGCTAISTANISAPGGPTAYVVRAIEPKCFGGNDGFVAFKFSGGVQPLTFTQSGGVGAGPGDPPDWYLITELSAGTYTLTISDANNCTFVLSVSLGQPPLLVPQVVLTQPASCAGATNGAATVGATGGTAPYAYAWPGGLAGATQTALAAGTYVVTVSDANNCAKTVSVTVGNNGQLNLSTLPNVGPLCPGETVPLIPLSSQPVDPATVYFWAGGAAAGLADGSSTGLNPHLPPFTASTTEGTYVVTVTANLQGCTAQRTFNIVIEDNTAPSFQNCPNTMLMAGNDPGQCSAKVNWSAPVAFDDCGSVAVTLAPGSSAPGAALGIGTHTVTYVANDGHGNTTQCVFTVLVLDTESPTVTCPTAPLGMWNIAADATCSFTQNTTAWDAAAQDNCSVVSLTHNYTAAPSTVTLNGATFPEGLTSVTWTATDPAGHTANCTFTVVVADKTVPVGTPGTCPPNVTVANTEDQCGAVVEYTPPTFDDNCDGVNQPGIRTSGLPSGAEFPVGATTVTYVYTDAANNGPAVCSFTVVVNDTQFPAIECPTDVVVTVDGTLTGRDLTPYTLLGTGPCGVTLTYTAPVGVDNCPGAETDLVSGAGGGANYYTFNGTYMHEWRVTDASGNTTTCLFSITVEDPVVPAIQCPANTTIATDPDECTAVVTYALPVLGDNCPGFQVSQLSGPASGEEFALGTTQVAFEVSDFAGNVTSCSFTVTVFDQQAPAPTCPLARNVLTSTGTAGDCQGLVPDLLPELLAADNCTPAATLLGSATQVPAAGVVWGNSNGATQTVVLTVTDAAGNSQTCSTVLTLRDDELPTLNCAPATRTVSANNACQYQATGSEFNPVWTDNCTGAILTHNYAPAPQAGTLAGATFPLGNTAVQFTVSDANGNTATCSLTVQVVDNQLPVFVNCPANLTVGNDVDQCGARVVFATPVAQDNCGATVTLVAPSLPSGSIFPSGPTPAGATSTVRFRATDAAGNSTDCVFTVTVLDVQMPKAICKDLVLNLDANGNASLTATNLNNNSIDNCTSVANLTLTVSQSSFGCANVGQNYVTLTVTDQAGNTNYCVSTVTVRDLIPPTLSCPPNTTVAGCSGLVPNLAAAASATDNCTAPGSIQITQNPVPGSAFGNSNGASVNVTITATDGHGNSSTCVRTVTISDVSAPVFQNCPLTTVMIGNDPDQCSGKLNWAAPVAFDNCPGVTVVQTAGPLPGTVVPATCPPTPQTVSYTATDAAGNVSTCNFQVMVVDTQKPRFDADILMPGNVTVQCNAVPANCIQRTGGTCTPLTNDDVNDNCTAPANLTVAFAEVSTQNPNQATCEYYSYTLTRTWTVTDCSGNARVHTQIVTVQDTQVPVALCKNVAVTLDKTGKASIVPADINNGSSDNCTAGGVLTYELQGVVNFTCAHLGVNLITLQVTDPCGNTASCSATVTVNEGIAPCTPQYQVETRCYGMNGMGNATTLNNGQFEDVITVKALAMQTWRISATNGQLYSVSSPAPPAAPLALPVGTTFTAGTADGLDNDGDGTTDEPDEMIFYTLRALHVDCQGYNISISNTGGQGMAPSATTASIQNKACYPTPVFSGLIGPFCLSTPPFTITATDLFGAQGTLSNVTIDGVPATVFDAADLGVGTHVVAGVFDAGSATTSLIINGVQVSGSAGETLTDSGCKQPFSTTVEVAATPSVVVCDDLVHVTLDDDCKVTVNPDQVLEGTYYCLDDYSVVITYPPGTHSFTPPNMVDGTHVGLQLNYSLVHALSGNVCWGKILVEDKTRPVLVCPAGATLFCTENENNTTLTGTPVVTDCSPYTLARRDVYEQFTCGQNASVAQRISRWWIATDQWGNQDSCLQIIEKIRGELSQVTFPPNGSFLCTQTVNGQLTPAVSGWPVLAGINLTTTGVGVCNLGVSYEDNIVNECPGSYYLVRTWTVFDFCPAAGGAPVSTTHVQYLSVSDVPPVVDLSNFQYDAEHDRYVVPTNATFNGQCVATGNLPAAMVSGGCNQVVSLLITTPFGNVSNGGVIPAPGLAIGLYPVTYTVQDECGNITIKTITVSVEDTDPPAVACKEWTQVALGQAGTATLQASIFNNGTTDNCCLDSLLARRMDESPCDSDTLAEVFGTDIQFCCADLGDTVRVVFRATDCYGNYNDCMVQVLVEDKLKPICEAPVNLVVACENFDPSLWTYGQATVTDNCCVDTLTTSVSYASFDTICNRGTIVRTFRAFDCSGNSSQCTQRVVVNYTQYYFVKFPDDKSVGNCTPGGDYGKPVFYGEDCELLATTYTDEVFTVNDGACFKIERTWTVINWCTYNQNQPVIYVPNPNPLTAQNLQLAGPIVSAPNNSVPGWTASVFTLDPGGAPWNYGTQSWAAQVNGYRYKQIINVHDNAAPVLSVLPDTCNPLLATNNDPQLWNDSFWYDTAISSHDLCEEPVSLTAVANDLCAGVNVSAHYLLFLDLDNDGTMETVVNSQNPLANNQLQPGEVLFGNAASPNFLTGTPQRFDFRKNATGSDLPLNERWVFAVYSSADTLQRTAKTVFRRGNQSVADANSPAIQLPHGTHKIKWIVSDGCGNETVQEESFTVGDCKKPTVVCHNGLTVNLMSTGMANLYAVDFLQYGDDNCTPAGQLQYGVRKSGAGAGFPADTGITLTCDDLLPTNTVFVELWVKDKAGNADFCETYVLLQDNMGVCSNSSGMASVAGDLATELQEGVEDAVVELMGMANGAPSPSQVYSNVTGHFLFSNALPLGADYTVTPTLDFDPTNGVTTYDLVLINRHILGLEPLSTPYKLIAADANKSGSITTFDIVEIRKLILGINTAFPNNDSWRFINATQVFTDAQNPFADVLQEDISVAQVQSNMMHNNFIGVKIGDVNDSAEPNQLVISDDRDNATLLFDLLDRDVMAGEEVTVTLSAAEAQIGFQFTLVMNGLQVIDVVPGSGMAAENFAVFQDLNALTASVNGGAGTFAVHLRATQTGRLSQMMALSNRITKSEAYVAMNEKRNVALRFTANGLSTVAGVGFELYQNAPNPWVSKTSIGFNLPAATEATLTLLDATGRVLLTRKEQFAKGVNSVLLDSQALANATGVIYYRLETATDSATRKMIRMK